MIGAMLYWGEGYKGSHESPAGLVDFANSDPEMIQMFLKFLRAVFYLDESKFRVYLYCHSNQNLKDIMDFWSNLTSIPITQFSKPYIKKDFGSKRVMSHGLVHIRYYDKKLLLEIKKMIDSYKFIYLRRSDSGYSSRL